MQRFSLLTPPKSQLATLSFIKEDPNFIANDQLPSFKDNDAFMVLQQIPAKPFEIRVTMREVHLGSELFTGNVYFAPENKERRLQIHPDGSISVFDASGASTNEKLEDFTFTQTARNIIKAIKAESLYREEPNRYDGRVYFSRDIPGHVPGKATVSISKEGYIWYQINNLYTAALDSIPRIDKQFHADVIRPLLPEEMRQHKEFAF